MSLHSITAWPLVLWEMERAEQAIEYGEMNGEVHVHCLVLDPVMPMVEARRDKKIFYRGKAPTQVCMHEGGIEIDEEDVTVHGCGAKTQHIHRDHGRAAQREDLEEMHPCSRHPIHAARRVMNGVEVPEPGNPMERPMDPILHEIGKEHDGDELD